MLYGPQIVAPTSFLFYVRAQVNYRKLSREEKAEAHFLFVQNTLDENGKGILPDPNNVEHLQKLKFIGDLVRKRYD